MGEDTTLLGTHGVGGAVGSSAMTEYSIPNARMKVFPNILVDEVSFLYMLRSLYWI